MSESIKPTADAAELRRRAEERLKRSTPDTTAPLTQSAAIRFVHELQVHQIELEMQNETLKLARQKAETAMARYAELYDFAPISYLTLDREGTILQVNLTGTRFLRVERSRLVNRRFGLFIADKDRTSFSDFLTRVFASDSRHTSEFTLDGPDSSPTIVRIEATRSSSGEDCRAVLIDISEIKLNEEMILSQIQDIRTQNDLLSRFNKNAVDREMRMIELKREINELCQKTGSAPRYNIIELFEPNFDTQ